MNSLSNLINRYRHANWALVDQAVVSGSNFVTGVLLARFLGPEAFGLFVLLQSVLLYVNSFQGALIFQPMMSAAPQLGETERVPYLQGVFALQLALSFGLASICLVLALLAYAFFHSIAGVDVAIAFPVVAAMLAFQLQDWQRRYYFVREKPRASFFNDLISYGSQVMLLALASINDDLNVANAFWIIAATSLTAFTIGFSQDHQQPVFSHARAVLRDGWRTGRDYLAAWQFQWLGSQGLFMLGAGVVGTQAVGAVRATQNIVGPINILFLAMDNMVTVSAARCYGSSGLEGLSRYLWRITWLGTALLVPLLLILALFSRPIMQLLYGDQYLTFVSLVYWQAGYVFIQFYLRQTFFFLRTVRATGIILRAGMTMAIVSVAVTALTVHRYQETGLMIALSSGMVAGLIYSVMAARKEANTLKYKQPSVISFDKNLSAGEQV